MDGAIQSVRVIPEETIRDIAYQNIARQLARAAQVPRALETVGKILSTEARMSVLLEIGEIQADARDRAGALSTLRMIEPPPGERQADVTRRIARAEPRRETCPEPSTGPVRGSRP